MKKEEVFHFRGQMEREEVIDFFRRHWIVILPSLIPFLLYMVGFVAVVINLPRYKLPSIDDPFMQLIFILGFTGTTIMIHRFFLKMIEYFMQVVIITNHRVIDVNQTTFLNDNKESIAMERMQEIQKRQKGIITSLLHFGDIVIIISFSDPKIIRTVPSPNYHFRLLNHIRNLMFMGERVTKDSVKNNMKNSKKSQGMPVFNKPDDKVHAFNDSPPDDLIKDLEKL